MSKPSADPVAHVAVAVAAQQAADEFVAQDLLGQAEQDVQQELPAPLRARDGWPTSATAVGCPCGCGETELLRRAQDGDRTAVDVLLVQYRALARKKASSYFLIGGDRDDLVQEALIGVYEAIRDYRPGAGASFRTLADVCVSRKLVDAVRAANRRKHQPLNTSSPLDLPAGPDDSSLTLADVLRTDPAADPSEQVAAAEAVRALQRHLDEVLSDLEQQVLRHHVAGRSYADIAAMLQRHVRSVDNALVRIRRKVHLHLADVEAAS